MQLIAAWPTVGSPRTEGRMPSVSVCPGDRHLTAPKQELHGYLGSNVEE